MEYQMQTSVIREPEEHRRNATPLTENPIRIEHYIRNDKRVHQVMLPTRQRTLEAIPVIHLVNNIPLSSYISPAHGFVGCW